MSDSSTYSEKNEQQEETMQTQESETPISSDTPMNPTDELLPVTAELPNIDTDGLDLIDDGDSFEKGDEEELPMPIIGRQTDILTVREPTLRVAKRCDLGAIRNRNEDSCLIFESEAGGHFPIMPFGLYIVADGMGGHKNGHIASKVASRTVASHIIDKIYLPLIQNDGNPVQSPIQEVMIDAVQEAHRVIYTPDPDKDSGTTLTAALILGRRLYVAHVGDSRLYWHTGNKLEPITTDHSLVQRLQEVGQLSAEEASVYQYRHILLRAVGQGEEIEVDTYMRLLPKEGMLLLCSDGLALEQDTIEAIISQEIPLQERVDQLYEAAMEAGGYDNITAILVDFRF